MFKFGIRANTCRKSKYPKRIVSVMDYSAESTAVRKTKNRHTRRRSGFQHLADELLNWESAGRRSSNWVDGNWPIDRASRFMPWGFLLGQIGRCLHHIEDKVANRNYLRNCQNGYRCRIRGAGLDGPRRSAAGGFGVEGDHASSARWHGGSLQAIDHTKAIKINTPATI